MVQNGFDESYTHFDPDLIMHINSVFSILAQIGVGPPNGFSITGESETWSDFIGQNANRFSLVKSYMHLKVKLLFDPPLSSAAIESINRQISADGQHVGLLVHEVLHGVAAEIFDALLTGPLAVLFLFPEGKKLVDDLEKALVDRKSVV